MHNRSPLSPIYDRIVVLSLRGRKRALKPTLLSSGPIAACVLCFAQREHRGFDVCGITAIYSRQYPVLISAEDTANFP